MADDKALRAQHEAFSFATDWALKEGSKLQAVLVAIDGNELFIVPLRMHMQEAHEALMTACVVMDAQDENQAHTGLH